MHNPFLNIHLAHFKSQKHKATIKKWINFVYSIEYSL